MQSPTQADRGRDRNRDRDRDRQDRTDTQTDKQTADRIGPIAWDTSICITDASLGRDTPSPDDWPDISVSHRGSHSNVELDISLIHPWNSEIIDNAAYTDGAQTQEGSKEEHLKGEESSKLCLLFWALLINYKRRGDHTESHLHQLSARYTDESGKSNPEDFVSHSGGNGFSYNTRNQFKGKPDNGQFHW